MGRHRDLTKACSKSRSGGWARMRMGEEVGVAAM
jgi:hypothetical protein